MGNVTSEASLEEPTFETPLQKAAYVALMLSMSGGVIGGAFWQKNVDDTRGAIAQVLVREVTEKGGKNILVSMRGDIWADMPNNEQYEGSVYVKAFETGNASTVEFIVPEAQNGWFKYRKIIARRAWEGTTPISLDSLK